MTVLTYLGTPSSRPEYSSVLMTMQARNLWLRWLIAYHQVEFDGNARSMDLWIKEGGEAWLNREVKELKAMGFRSYTTEGFEQVGAEFIAQIEQGNWLRDLVLFERLHGAGGCGKVSNAAFIGINRQFSKMVYSKGFDISDVKPMKWYLKRGSNGVRKFLTERRLQNPYLNKGGSSAPITLAKIKLPNCGYFYLDNVGTGTSANAKKMLDDGWLEIGKRGLTVHFSKRELMVNGTVTGVVANGGGGSGLISDRFLDPSSERNSKVSFGDYFYQDEKRLFDHSGGQFEEYTEYMARFFQDTVVVLKWEPPEG